MSEYDATSRSSVMEKRLFQCHCGSARSACSVNAAAGVEVTSFRPLAKGFGPEDQMQRIGLQVHARCTLRLSQFPDIRAAYNTMYYTVMLL